MAHSRETCRIDEGASVHSSELVERVPEERRGSFVGIREVAVAIADQDRVGGLGMQLAVVPLDLGEPVDELCVAKCDRRGAGEHT